MKLTVKQQKFADNYIKSGNATQAAIDAGYTKRSARQAGAKNMTKHDIKAYIDAKMAEIESHKIMDATEALQTLTGIARGEIKETVFTSTPAGVFEDEKSADLKTRITAIKEILKRYPDNDKLLSAQVRKMVAEASIAESKAAGASNSHSSQMDTLDQLLTTITEETLNDEEGRDEIGQGEAGRPGTSDGPQTVKPPVHTEANDGPTPGTDQ